MARIACLFVPDFPLAALCRAEPELAGQPLAVTDGFDPRAPLLAVSREAMALGVRKGLSVAQARAISGALQVRRVTAGCLRAAEDALGDVADSFSPRVEASGGGVVFLDIDRLAVLFGSEGHLATSLAARSHRIGLEARVGVASSKTAARLAARQSEGITVLPPDREREELSPLPLTLLDPSPELALTFERWGIRSVGDLACLPSEAVGSRLGESGLELRRRARGEDEEPLSPRPRALRFEETIDCEYAIDRFEPLSFLLHAALERLTTRLEVRGLRAGDLELSLRLEGRAHEERPIRVAAPTNEVKVLLGLTRVSFETHPPRGPVEAFLLAAAPERLHPIELDLFAPSGPAPEELDMTIARLSAIAGVDRVGSPVTVNSHQPGAFAMERFSPPTPTAALANGAPDSVLALRTFRPPIPIDVVCDRGHPDFIRYKKGTDLFSPPLPPRPRAQSPLRGENKSVPFLSVLSPFSGRVVTLGGPWRLNGEWWRAEPLARDYYDAEISNGCVYRIYREHVSGRWYADGVYD